MFNVNDEITVKANSALGTDEVTATVVSVKSWGYIVHIEDDEPYWNGPVDFDGNILSEMGSAP